MVTDEKETDRVSETEFRKHWRRGPEGKKQARVKKLEGGTSGGPEPGVSLRPGHASPSRALLS